MIHTGLNYKRTYAQTVPWSYHGFEDVMTDTDVVTGEQYTYIDARKNSIISHYSITYR
jgi:hypothetical protein